LSEPRRALVVNCSAPHYNVGALKLAGWLAAEGWTVTTATPDLPPLLRAGFDLVALSVIFSWHAPIARDFARQAAGAEVWCGGPGVAALASWWKKETGFEVTVGLDWRFERHRGEHLMTFASRGCPVGCSFCIVPKIEGTDFTLDWDFRPAPVLCDNNLSALPAEFQEHVIRRYRESGTVLRDANSGFEPRAFTEETFQRWAPMIRGPWRFAFDEQREAAEVAAMMRILRHLPAGRKRVYVLIGNEPMADCFERALNVIDWGGEPYVQPVMRLNVLDKRDLWVRHDWTPELLRNFARYFNGFAYRNVPIEDYRATSSAPTIFAGLLRSPQHACGV
jgi:hypothetical protein